MTKQALLIALLFTVYPSHIFGKIQEKPERLQATSAALVIQSIQLGEKSQQIFRIKDGLLERLKAKRDDLVSQQDFIVDTATELKYIATVAYFEGNLLGAVLAIKEEFKLQYISNRLLELENAMRNTIASLRPIQISYSTIKDPVVLSQIERSIKATQSLIEMYKNSIDILQKMLENNTEE